MKTSFVWFLLGAASYKRWESPGGTFLLEANGDELLDGVASEMTKMGSLIGHRIDCNGVWALRGQQHMPKGGGGEGRKGRTVTCCLSSAFFSI